MSKLVFSEKVVTFEPKLYIKHRVFAISNYEYAEYRNAKFIMLNVEIEVD